MKNRSTNTGLSRESSWTSILIVIGAGSSLGAFLSRVLVELPVTSWPIWGWGGTLALTLAFGLGPASLWWRLRARSIPAWSVAPFYLLVLYLAQPAPNLLQAGIMLSGVLILALTLGVRRALAERWVVLTLFVVPLGLYLSTLLPAVGERDGYELQAISATLGFAHPTGYPLFPILGRAWIAVFPFGSIAWRINVLCALFAAASIPFVYAVARRVLVKQAVAAWSALAFAFSRTLWTQASQPEKYTLNAFFVALILYLAFGVVDPQRRGSHPYLRWLAFAYGLSLTHHRTMLMLAPALSIYVLWRDPGLLKRPKTWLSALGVALVPLLVYLYIPWRACAQGGCMSAPEFLRYVSGATYGPAIRLFD